MKYFGVLLVLMTSLVFAQTTGEVFPEMGGVTLDDEEITVPIDTKGKYTFLALAFSKEAEHDLNTWAEPLYYHFMPESKGKNLFASFYDVNLFFVPMFSGAAQVVEKNARKKAIEHLDEKLHSKVLFYKGGMKEMKEYKKVLDMSNKKVPYFFLLDENGKIVQATSGAYTQQKMIPFDNILDEAGVDQ